MKLKLTTVAFIALSHLTLLGQEIRLKGMLFPVLEQSVAVEALLSQNLSFQLTYQNHYEGRQQVFSS